MNNIKSLAWVVDDDSLYREMVTSFLKAIGYKVMGFSSARECLGKLDDKPEFVILDHSLGGKFNGLDTLRSIKQEKPELPVIYVSGETQKSVMTEAYQYGCVEYIEKDSATFLRIKLRIEKIEKIKTLHQKHKSNKKRILISLSTGIVTAIAAFVLLYYFL